jgi:hypothetical protein
LDWTSIRNLKNIDRITILDSIDEYRANFDYFNLLKEMKMDQRIVNIRDWLVSNNWKAISIRELFRKVRIRNRTEGTNRHIKTHSKRNDQKMMNNLMFIFKSANYKRTMSERRSNEWNKLN